MRKIILCADDAGWNESNDEVITNLALSKSLSAISILVDGRSAAEWKFFETGSTVALGLHLSLTWRPDRGSKGLGRLILSAFANLLSQTWLKDEIERQILLFETMLSRRPDFVDGHQHVHMLPGVRIALMDILSKRYGNVQRPAIRVPFSRAWRGVKASSLNWLGARGLDAAVRKCDWPANQDFAGAYDMRSGTDYRPRMQRWLASIGNKGLIMAHPGCRNSIEHGTAREHESIYLGSSQWLEDRNAAGVHLIPFTAKALRAIAA